ncbi:MAG: histidine--tRNA ligase [Candidatus Moraniibacteriota bacterium]|nr:MAG: histidine--tRNA ligase [Candidatus Moranbacteria bacterium]
MNKKDVKVKTDSYKGVRDFYPKEWRFQKWLFWQMAEVCERFGYENYAASPLEYTELFEAKSGKEIIENETYNLVDRGNRNVTLRPEMTPTIARMIAAKGVEIPRPIRWYSIPNLFRYERPQKGRLREHYQLNVDIFGIVGIEAEIEVIEVGVEIMKNLGAEENDFEIRVNNRKIMNALFTRFTTDEDAVYELSKLIDKKKKISTDNFTTAVEKILGEKASEFISVIEKFSLENCITFANAEDIEKTKKLLNTLRAKGMKNVIFDLTLMRGFDYYTEIVFEFFDTDPKNNRSMFGGGRYDDLLDIFGKEKVPAVGFGMGDVTAKNFVESRNPKMLEQVSKTDVFIAVESEGLIENADGIAKKMREDGKNVEVDYSFRKIDRQIHSAERKGIKKVIVVEQRGVREVDLVALNN